MRSHCGQLFDVHYLFKILGYSVRSRSPWVCAWRGLDPLAWWWHVSGLLKYFHNCAFGRYLQSTQFKLVLTNCPWKISLTSLWKGSFSIYDIALSRICILIIVVFLTRYIVVVAVRSDQTSSFTQLATKFCFLFWIERELGSSLGLASRKACVISGGEPAASGEGGNPYADIFLQLLCKTCDLCIVARWVSLQWIKGWPSGRITCLVYRGRCYMKRSNFWCRILLINSCYMPWCSSGEFSTCKTISIITCRCCTLAFKTQINRVVWTPMDSHRQMT